MDWIKQKIDEYCQWLRNNTDVRKDLGTEWYSLSTPFIGLFNDHVEIFVKREGTNILISDDGWTLDNLSMVGVDFNRSEKRRKILDNILNTYGVTLQGSELIVKANDKDFPMKKHALVSAIMNINDLEVLSSNKVNSFFQDDVQTYLDSREIIYSPSIILKGLSGLDYNFNFQIAGRKSELVIKTYETIKQDNVTSFLYCVQDVQNNRRLLTDKKFRSLLIINDEIREPSSKLIEVLTEKEVEVAKWSEKDKIDNLLKVS